MHPETQRRLRALSQRFYDERAEAFDASRDHPWPGWRRLLSEMEATHEGDRPLRVLDVACGNGRFARFLAEHGTRPFAYTGIDASEPLLEAARAQLAALASPRAPQPCRLQGMDVLDEATRQAIPGAAFDLVVAFGLTHHVPGAQTRRAMVGWLADRVAPDGWIALTVWRFADRARFADRLLPWEALEPDLRVDPDTLEPGDHLLGFGDRAGPPRYCHHSSAEEIEAFVACLRARGFASPTRYDEDGRSHDLNHYLIAHRAADSG